MLNIVIAIPILNEEEVIPTLVERLHLLINSNIEASFRVVFIDDGSTDNSIKLIENIRSTDSRFGYVSFSRNFGHQAALAAAIDMFDGDILVIMDADLQDPPELIPQMIEHYKEGNDIVYTYRTSRSESIFKKCSYFIFYRIMKLLCSTEINLDSGDFVLLSKRVVLELKSLGEYHKFYREMRCWVGFRQKGIPLERPARLAGDPKYSLKKLCTLGLDGIFSFTLIPLRLAYLIGLMSIIFSFAFVVYAIVTYFILLEVPTGFTAIIFFIIFTFGVQLVMVGIIGEYIGRIFQQVKNRPVYIKKNEDF